MIKIKVPASAAGRYETVCRMIKDGRLTHVQGRRFLDLLHPKRPDAEDDASRWLSWMKDFKHRMGPEEFDSGLARALWGMGLTAREASYNMRCQAIERRLAKERAERFVADVMKARGWKPTVKDGVWVGG